MTEAELVQAVASLEARAELAERNGLPKTAKSWRDTVENMRAELRAYLGEHYLGLLALGGTAIAIPLATAKALLDRCCVSFGDCFHDGRQHLAFLAELEVVRRATPSGGDLKPRPTFTLGSSEPP
jgi:hypothetical protein